MKFAVYLTVSLAALSLAACKDEQAPAPNNVNTGAPTDVASMAPPVAAESPAQAFINTAAANDMFEIEASRLAASKASADETKRFAEEMIKAHTDATQKLKAAATAASPAMSPVASMTAAQSAILADLRGAPAAGFDKAYATAQINAHQSALDALKAYSANGAVPSLKAFATQMVPVVTAHLNLAKSL
jgi:putative membrane protein